MLRVFQCSSHTANVMRDVSWLNVYLFRVNMDMFSLFCYYYCAIPTYIVSSDLWLIFQICNVIWISSKVQKPTKIKQIIDNTFQNKK